MTRAAEGNVADMTTPGESLPDGPDTDLEGEDRDELTVPEAEPDVQAAPPAAPGEPGASPRPG